MLLLGQSFNLKSLCASLVKGCSVFVLPNYLRTDRMNKFISNFCLYVFFVLSVDYLDDIPQSLLLNTIKLHDYQTWTATPWKISQLCDALNKKMIYVMTFVGNRMLDSMPIFKWYVHTVWNATQGILSIVYMICEMKTFSSLFVPGWA